MSKRLRLALDAMGLLVLATGLWACAAVLSHDPADAPVSVHPAHAYPANLAGRPGAAAARRGFDILGLAVYPALFFWLMSGFSLLLEGRKGTWSWRLLGSFLLVPGLSLALDALPSPLAALAPQGSGGRLGAALHQLLAAELNPRAAWLAGLGTLALGLLLAGDALWPRLARGWCRGLVRVIQACQRWQNARRQAAAERRLRKEQEGIPIHKLDVAAEEVQQARVAAVPSPAPPRQPQRNHYQLPPFDLLAAPEPFPYEVHEQQLRERAAKLEKTFADFSLNVHVVGINTGPVITQYEVALETGLRLHKVTRLADDIALNLKVPSVRMVAPIPGKDTVGVEIPNEQRATVRLKEVILAANGQVAKQKIPLFLGKDTEGRPLVYDLADMPHLLIAGRTGTGKSVCMNAIILSILMTRRPDEVKMVMIDPKMLELSEYGRIPHLMHPVVKDMKKAEAILAWAVDKMEERYDLLSRARVRGIAGYNELEPEEIYRRVKPVDEEEKARIPERMPYIVIFVDEMNDLMMTMRKEVEGHIIRLAQKSRAAGIHLVVATQKPTVDVITGLIKSNLPARICFQVSSRTDSRVVLDEMGAEKLLGKGDMLFLQPGTSTILRAQGTYASDAEITRVVEFLECEPAYSRELVQLSSAGGRDSAEGQKGLKDRDELYEAAVDVIIREGRGSVSLLQRALGIGYGRAARLIDFMAEDGIVGGYNGSNAREVLLTPEQWEQMKAEAAA